MTEAPGRNRTRATLVGGEHAHHCTNPVPQLEKKPIGKLVQVINIKLQKLVAIYGSLYPLIHIVFLTDVSGQAEILNWTLQSLKITVVERVTSSTWNT